MLEDSEIIFLLCSREERFADSKPYSATEWGAITRRLRLFNMRLIELFLLDAETIKRFEGTAVCDKVRLAKLFDRRNSMRAVLMKYARWNVKIVTLADPEYPQSLIKNLKDKAPPVLCCVGNVALLNQPALGMVGSRRINEDDATFLKKIAVTATIKGQNSVSGGAIGSDRVSETCALSCNGAVVSYVAEPIYRTYNYLNNRDAIDDGRLLLVTAHSPSTPFSTPVALERNRYIYAHSEGTVISKSDFKKGGTWHGANEALKNKTCPIYVNADAKSEGNRELVALGAHAITSDWSNNELTHPTIV